MVRTSEHGTQELLEHHEATAEMLWPVPFSRLLHVEALSTPEPCLPLRDHGLLAAHDSQEARYRAPPKWPGSTLSKPQQGLHMRGPGPAMHWGATFSLPCTLASAALDASVRAAAAGPPPLDQASVQRPRWRRHLLGPCMAG